MSLELTLPNGRGSRALRVRQFGRAAAHRYVGQERRELEADREGRAGASPVFSAMVDLEGPVARLPRYVDEAWIARLGRGTGAYEMRYTIGEAYEGGRRSVGPALTKVPVCFYFVPAAQ